MSTHVVAEVCVHEEDKVARAQLQAVDVGAAEAELAGALQDLDLVGAEDLLELEGDLEKGDGEGERRRGGGVRDTEKDSHPCDARLVLTS